MARPYGATVSHDSLRHGMSPLLLRQFTWPQQPPRQQGDFAGPGLPGMRHAGLATSIVRMSRPPACGREANRAAACPGPCARPRVRCPGQTMTRSVARPPLGQGWGTLWAEVEAAAGRRHHPLRPRDRPHPGRPSAAAVPGPADPVDPVGPVAPVAPAAPAADQQMADPPSTVAPEEQAGTAESAAPAAPGEDIPTDSAPDIGEIVAAAQNGDAEAFGELYDRYVDTVYRYVYYRVPDRATAEDMTSETFTHALRRIDSFSWKGRDFAAWLITIARNLLADHYKSSRYRLEVPATARTPAPRTRCSTP